MVLNCMCQGNDSGQRHAEWDLCMYLQSPITPILPGVIQQAVQFHSCHHNVVIWIIETGTHLNTILLQTLLFPCSKCRFIFILFIFSFFAWSGWHHGQNKDNTMHAGPPRCVQWAWTVKIPVRGWQSWGSSSPSGIAHQLPDQPSAVESRKLRKEHLEREKLMKFTDWEVSADGQHLHYRQNNSRHKYGDGPHKCLRGSGSYSCAS